MNRCETCKHWCPFEPGERNEWSPIAKNRLGLCGGIDQENDHMGHVNMTGPDTPPDDIQACTTDLSDMSALRTRADFGCVLWAAKR